MIPPAPGLVLCHAGDISHVYDRGMSLFLIGLVLYVGGKALLQVPAVKRFMEKPSLMELYRTGKVTFHDGRALYWRDPD